MSWHFARTPKWIVRHLLVAALVVSMVLLGLWQLRRLDDKRDHNALVESRQDEPVMSITEVVPWTSDVGDEAVDDVLYRTVEARGTYLDDDTVVVENRTYNGAPGAWVLTPLLLPSGSAVVVNRGFIGFDREGEISPPPAPSGPVEVVGLVYPSQRRGTFGATDPDGEDLGVLARADLDRYEAQLDYDLLPAYVQRETSTPPEAAAAEGAQELVPLEGPDLDEGPHLGYAVQWFIFTMIAAGGYVLLLRRVAKDEGRRLRVPPAAAPAP